MSIAENRNFFLWLLSDDWDWQKNMKPPDTTTH